MQAVLLDIPFEGMTRPDLIKEIDRIEKLSVNVSQSELVFLIVPLWNEMVSNKGFPEHSVNRALEIMVQQDKLF